MDNQISSPIRRKVYIREVIENLITSTKVVNDHTFQQNFDHFGNVQSSVSNTSTAITPMEVDESGDHSCSLEEKYKNDETRYQNMYPAIEENYSNKSSRGKDDSGDRASCLKEKCKTNETNTNPFPLIEEYYKNKMSQGKSAKVYTRRATVLSADTFTNALWAIIFCLTVVLICFLTVGDPFVTVNEKFDLEGLRLELEQEVLGQRTAVEDIVHSFERVDSWMQKVKIMPFVGSNGVGKTFTVNIIEKYFDPSAVFTIYGFQFLNLNVQTRVLETITDSYFNLIIIDELQSSQMGSLFEFVNKLPKFDKKILVVPIFNIQRRTMDDRMFKIDEEAFWQIRDQIDRSGFYFEVILFHTLTNSTLKSYVRKELVRRNIDAMRHDQIIDSFIQDKNIEYTGLKGISLRLRQFIYKMFPSAR